MKYLIPILLALSLPSPAEETIAAGNLRISKASEDLILYYETGGQGYYTSRLQKPTVPPGASGITIGIGYDLGYNSREQIGADWLGRLPAAQIARLQGVAGLKGASAKAALIRVKDIIIPWDTAVAVYKSRTVPRFARMTEQAYPGILKTAPDVQGVFLSMTFNRGSAFTPYDRRKEMVWSRNDVQSRNYVNLPDYQLQMRRLWPSILGLQRRYAAHAGLLQHSLDTQKP